MAVKLSNRAYDYARRLIDERHVEPRAFDRRDPADLEARSARLRQGHQPAARAGRPGRRDHLDIGGAAHGQAVPEAGRRRGSPRLRLVR